MKNSIEKLIADLGQIKLESDSQNEGLKKVLRQLLDILDCDRAWCLYPCDPEADFWTVPIEVSKYQWPGAFEIGLEIPLGDVERAVFKSFVNAKHPVTYGKGADYPMPLDHEQHFKIKAQIATVVYPEQGEQWMLGVHYCDKYHSFTEEDRVLFDRLAKKIGRTFDNLTFDLP